MPRIQRDPNLDEMPDFDSEDFTTSFAALATEDNPLESIVQRAKDAWTASHRRKVEEWERQVEEDEADERALEEERARDAEERRKAQEEIELQQRAEREKKRPKVKDFAPQKQASSHSVARPSQFAINKVKQLEYCEMWYFTPQGCEDAKLSDKTASSSSLTLAQGEAGLILTPASIHKPSAKVVPDEKLSWHDMSIAKASMLRMMQNEQNWPRGHVLALLTFFMEMDNHPMRRQQHGEDALLLYMAEVRREWHDELKSSDENVTPFDISCINQERVKAAYTKVLEQKQLSLMARSVPVGPIFGSDC